MVLVEDDDVKKSRAHVFFTGKVQGVYFRAHAKQKAGELGVDGWVRNVPDGRVEAVFEGHKEDVEAIIEYCKFGQPYARVLEAMVEWGQSRGETGFAIIQ